MLVVPAFTWRAAALVSVREVSFREESNQVQIYLRTQRWSFSPRSWENIPFFPMRKRCSKNSWQTDQNRRVGRRPVWFFTAQHQHCFKPCCQKQPVKNVSTISGQNEIQNVTGPVKGRQCVFGRFDKNPCHFRIFE